MLLFMRVGAVVVVTLMLAVVVVGDQRGEEGHLDAGAEVRQQSDNAVDITKMRRKSYDVATVQCPTGAICDDPDRCDSFVKTYAAVRMLSSRSDTTHAMDHAYTGSRCTLAVSRKVSTSTGTASIQAVVVGIDRGPYQGSRCCC